MRPPLIVSTILSSLSLQFFFFGEQPFYEPEDVEILREMLLLLLDIGADPKLGNKNGQTSLDSCETDAARMILSEKRGLSAMNVDVGDVSNINIL